MRPSRARLGSSLLIIAWIGLGQGPAQADPRKLALSDLTASQEKQLWERADRYAGYEAMLKRCAIAVQFERRIRAEAEPCIEPETLDKVAVYFRRQFERSVRTIRGNPCQDPYFVEHGLADKLRLTLDDQIQAVKTLCTHYQRTGIFRSER